MKRSRLMLLSIALGISGILLLGVVGTGNAAPVTFDFTFSGEPGNSAIATGFITVTDVTVIPNPTSVPVEADLPNADISALSVTVSGASSGNGTFGLADFATIVWSTNGGTLDFTEELVGQPTAGDPWGTPSEGDGGDFNLIPVVKDPLPDPAAPGGIWWFVLAANYDPALGQAQPGDTMILTSMLAREVGAVPEPATMLLLGSGLIVLWGARKKFKK